MQYMDKSAGDVWRAMAQHPALRAGINLCPGLIYQAARLIYCGSFLSTDISSLRDLPGCYQLAYELKMNNEHLLSFYCTMGLKV